jgi:hypothetical protein
LAKAAPSPVSICKTSTRRITVPSLSAPLYEEATRLIVADCPDICLQPDRAGRRVEPVKGARYCPVGSGCEVRWMSLSA